MGLSQALMGLWAVAWVFYGNIITPLRGSGRGQEIFVSHYPFLGHRQNGVMDV